MYVSIRTNIYFVFLFQLSIAECMHVLELHPIADLFSCWGVVKHSFIDVLELLFISFFFFS